MRKYLVLLLLLAPTCFALQPLESSELESANVASGIIAPIQNSENSKNSTSLAESDHLSDEQKRFKLEIDKNIGKIHSIYKEQIRIHNLPKSECISFNFQITKDGIVKSVEAEKKYISVENSELILSIISMFKKTRFSSTPSDLSTPYKFCFLQ